MVVVLGAAVRAQSSEANSKEASAALAAEREVVVKTVRLEHGDAEVVADFLNSRVQGPVQVIPIGSHRIVVRGSPELVQLIVDKYIRAIDVAKDEGDSEQTHFVSIRYYPMDEVIRLVKMLVPTRRVAVDELHHTLVFNADAATAKAVRELLNQIDRPSQSATLQYFFLRAQTEGVSSGTPAEPLPPALQAVGKTLAENGFQNPALMAPMTVLVEEGKAFESSAQFHHRKGDQSQEPVQFSVSGKVEFQSESQVAQLTLQAGMGGVFRLGEDGPNKPVHFEVDTTVAVKAGDYVILAAAPSSTAQGDAIALVVRVLLK